jgi:hypothetical protein
LNDLPANPLGICIRLIRQQAFTMQLTVHHDGQMRALERAKASRSAHSAMRAKPLLVFA